MKFKTQTLVAFLFGSLFAFCGVVEGQVRLELKNNVVQLMKSEVVVQDVAALQGSDAIVNLVRILDLDAFGDEQKELRISKQQIRIRAMLAGVKELEVVGPDEVRVVRVKQIDARQLVETAIQSQLSRQYTIPASVIQVTLDGKFRMDSLGGSDFLTMQIDPFVKPEIPLGRQTVAAQVRDARGELSSFNASVEVAIFRELAVAKTDIARGMTLDESNIEAIRRPMTTNSGSYLTMSHALGRQASVDIEMYSVVKKNQVRQTSQKSKALIGKNQIVSAVLQRGGLKLTLREVKAVHDANRGEVIEVINLKTKESMVGRVVDANTVQLR